MVLLHKQMLNLGFMTTYTVQFILPVDNPVLNVSITRAKTHMKFEVPINHPDAHKMGLMDLIAAAELSGLHTVSPTLNKKIDLKEKTCNNHKP